MEIATLDDMSVTMTSKQDNIAWLSAAPRDSNLIRGFDLDIFQEDKDRGLDIVRRLDLNSPWRIEEGGGVEAHELPKILTAKRPSENKKRPDLFYANGVWIVSAPFAEVVKRHELGRNQLAKVTVLKTNGKTPIEGSYYCLAFADVKDTFDADESKDISDWPQNTWCLSYTPANDQVALKPSALVGADLWVEKRFANAFFLSDRLLKALRAAKVTRTLKPYRCRIID